MTLPDAPSDDLDLLDKPDDDLDHLEDDHDEQPVIRAKWSMDGATTLAEAASLLRAHADHLESLARDGCELDGPVEDDYGMLRRP